MKWPALMNIIDTFAQTIFFGFPIPYVSYTFGNVNVPDIMEPVRAEKVITGNRNLE